MSWANHLKSLVMEEDPAPTTPPVKVTLVPAPAQTVVYREDYSELDQLAADISLTNYIAALHGYTDNAKWAGDINGTSYDKNMQLSDDRAKSVKAYLIRKGVRNTLRSYAHGQEDPVADNSTPAGRAMNRRVTVVLGE